MRSFRDIAGEFIANVKKMDFALLAATSALSLISILTLVGGYENFGVKRIVMQTGATVVGMVFMFVIASIDYRVVAQKLGLILIGGSALLLIITLIFGTSEGENKSWLYLPLIPFGIQPSEFIKACFLLSFGQHLFLVREKINKPKQLLFLLIHAGIYIGLILLSGDLGVALVYTGICAVMMFCAGLSMWYFAGAVGAVGIASPVLWKLLREDQKQRVLVGFNPDIDPLGKGFQPIKSRSSVANGGFFGKGMFGGSVYQTYAASHTDFIFGTVCEKFGFIGAVAVIGLLIFIVVRVIKLAQLTRRDCGTFVCIGFAAMIIVQAVENIGMCLGMLPVVGITLPYMSYGGSSVLAIYIITGVVQSVAVHRNRFHVQA